MTGGAVRRPSSHVVASLPCPRVGVTLPGVHGADVVCSRGCVRSRTTALDHPRSGHAPRCADGRRGSFVPPKPLRLLQVVLRTLSLPAPHAPPAPLAARLLAQMAERSATYAREHEARAAHERREEDVVRAGHVEEWHRAHERLRRSGRVMVGGRWAGGGERRG